MNCFHNAVLNTDAIAECLQPGLQALEDNSKKINVGSNTRQLEGSVNIDGCLTKTHPNEPRWDYVFGYNGEVYYVEVHKATIGEVEKVIAKVEWLKKWLHRVAPNLKDLPTSGKYYWIHTGRSSIRERDHRCRSSILKLAKNNIELPRGELDLR